MPGPMSMPLSMNGMSEGDQNVLNIGKQALASGTVTPDEVQQAAGTLSDDPSWLKKHLGGDQKKKYVFGDQGSASPGKAAPSSKSEKKSTSVAKSGSTTNSYLEPEEYQNLLSMANSNPDIQDQRKGIQDQTDMLKMQLEHSTPNSDYWVKPLSALADSTTGSKLSSTYAGQPTQDQKNQKLYSAMDELQKRKGDLSKTVLESITKMKNGSTTDQTQTNNLMSQILGSGMGLGGLAEVRMEKMRQDAGKAFNSDKKLTNLGNAFDSYDKAKKVINGDVPVTSANYNTLQEDATRMMTMGGSQVADGKLQRESTKLFAELKNNAKTYFGKDDDLRKSSPATFSRLQAFMDQVRSDFDAAYEQRLREVEQPYKASPYPAVVETARAAADNMRKARIGGTKTLEERQAEEPGAAPAASGTVKIPAGRPDESWTPEQLKAYLKKGK